MSSVQQLLYYPLGLAPSLFFSLRGLLLWFQSERAKRSHLSPLFWYFSVVGNGLQALHYGIQIQYPFALIQAISGVLAWRNINLMQTKHPPYALKRVIGLIIAAALGLTLLFALFVHGSWLRVPVFSVETTLLWHVIGCLGGFLFASRFWVQWWCAEKAQTSYLGLSFFWLSFIGSGLSLLYFAQIRDWISFVQYGTGLIPYVRTFMLFKREKDLL